MKSTPHANATQSENANKQHGTHTPLVQGFWPGAWAYPDNDTITRHEEYSQRRAERKARHEEREQMEFRDNRTKIMLASAFLCAGISLGVMTRLGENLLSSIVYGAMIGAFVDLLGAITMTLLGMSDSLGWDEYVDADYEEYEVDSGDADFAGLGRVMPVSFVTGNPKDVSMTASFMPLEQDTQPEATGNPSQDDMRAFIESLASDAGRRQDGTV